MQFAIQEINIKTHVQIQCTAKFCIAVPHAITFVCLDTSVTMYAKRA